MLDNPLLIPLYQKMYEMTEPECRSSCRCPQSCCDSMYCDIAKEYAKEVWSADLQPTGHPTLPFMSATGCIVPPHMRPMCTLHTCDIGGLGFKRNDPKWTAEYFRLRGQIETIEGEAT